MALYKIVPKNPYYFWSVMSLIMQVSMAFRMGLRFVFSFVIFCLVHIKDLGHVEAAAARVDGPTQLRSGQAKSEKVWLVTEGGRQ